MTIEEQHFECVWNTTHSKSVTIHRKYIRITYLFGQLLHFKRRMLNVVEGNVCRVCMISSDGFQYFSLMEKKIFKNVPLCEAFTLITGLSVSATFSL